MSDDKEGGSNPVSHHYHDAFGEADSGVDYGPPIDLEEDEHDDDGRGIDAAAADHDVDRANDINPAQSLDTNGDEDVKAAITLEELEEEVGLREATLESLHGKLTKLNNEIKAEEQTSSLLQGDIENLKKKKLALKERTENNVHLVKELEGSLEKCLERLRRALDAEGNDSDDLDRKEEGKIDDDLQLLEQEDQISGENGYAAQLETETSNQVEDDDTNRDHDSYEIIKMPISMTEEGKGGVTKKVRKQAAALPFAFPVWRTSANTCPLFTNLDSPKLLLNMMNTTVLEHLLCREEEKVEGCGQLHESKIWGTSLDVMIHVRWDHLLPSLKRVVVETPTDSGESRLDPNVQLCPYELGGTCADEKCPYQHLSRPKQTDDATKDSAQDEELIRYHSLSKLALPPSPFSDSKRISEHELTDADDVNMNQSHGQPHILEESDEELDASDEPSNQQCFEQNDDYVSLPTLTTTTDNDTLGSSNNCCEMGFSERFWWYSEHPFDTTFNGNEESHDVFVNVLASFGFRRNAEFLESMVLPCSGDVTKRQMYLLLDARLVDLSRCLIHMGQGAFALAVLHTLQKSGRFNKTLKLLRQQVEASTCCTSSQIMFDTQLSLLMMSKYVWARLDKPDMDFATLESTLGIIVGQKKGGKYNKLFQSIVSRRPKRQKISSTQSKNNWAAFEKSLQMMLDRHVIVPFSQLTKGEEYSYFENCVRVGKVLEHAVYKFSQEYNTFSPLLNVLEPVWALLQTMLQTSYALSRASDWLKPDLVATVIIGPVIFACVSKTIAVAVPSATQDEDKCVPKYDMRTIASLNYLDKCIVGILKTLYRSNQENGMAELVELLISPLHALSAGVSMATRMVDKTQMKLSYALSKGRTHRDVPSLFAMSSELWSQLVQFHITFPVYTSALRYDCSTPSLAQAAIRNHQDIVSRVYEHGVVLHNVLLPGDYQITTSKLSTKGSKDQYKAVWEDVKRGIYAQHSKDEDQPKTVNEMDLVVANYMNKEYSCFPETLLLAGGMLTKLRMTNCGLKKLPVTLGFSLSNLQVLNLSNNLLRTLPPSLRYMQSLKVLNVAHNELEEFPDMVIHCKLLEVIDVSHNNLCGYPRDLALRLPRLQSFVVDNNPI